ncbi:MAG TPA: hypothetical protein VGL81_32120 [Polyangiaceae bacterium]
MEALLARPPSLDGACARLAAHLGVLVRNAVAGDLCRRWAEAVAGARAEWTPDFGGEQFSLGRAFYTHLETDRTRRYFEDAAASDARVERQAPGLQSTMRALMAEAVGGRVTPRPGWCGAGVHVFPARGALAKRGGVVHFDTEGLAAAHLARRIPALSLVLMLQPPAKGGGLRLWAARYAGRDDVDDATLRAGGDVTIEYEAGDAVLFDSYRCHQIQPFAGARDRISSTLHAAEIDRGSWETWF